MMMDLAGMCRNVQAWLDVRLTQFTSSRLWLVKTVGVSLLVSLLITFPRIAFFWGDEQLVNMWPAIQWQADHPLQQFPDDPSSHSAKTSFRLVMPVIMMATGLPWQGLLALQYIAGLVSAALIGATVHQLTRDRNVAALGTFAFLQLLAGKSAFLQLGGVGDPLAICFLIGAVWSRAPALIFALCFLAGFTDERGAVAIGLVAVFHSLSEDGRLRWTTPTLAAVLAALSYFLARTALSQTFNLHTPVGPGTGLEPVTPLHNLTLFQLEIPAALSGLWFPSLLLIVFLLRGRLVWSATFIILMASAIIAVAMLVQDIDRSLMYLTPLLLMPFKVKFVQADQQRALYVLAALICVLTPVNSYIGVSGPVARYSEGNLAPVELLRAWVFVHQKNGVASPAAPATN